MPFTTTFASLSSKGFSSDLPIFVDYLLEDTELVSTSLIDGGVSIAGDTADAIILGDPSFTKSTFPSITQCGRVFIEGMAGNTLPSFSTATAVETGTVFLQELGRDTSIDKNGTYAVASPTGPSTSSGVDNSHIYYAATANNWSLQTTIGPVGTYDTFGQNGVINQNGDTISVHGKVAGGTESIEISSRTGVSTWSFDQTLTNGGTNDAFGARSDFNTAGDALVVGAYAFDGATYTNEGRAYIYELSGGTWSLTATLQSPVTPTQNDWSFGIQVQMNTTGDSVVISALRAFGTGAAFRFEKSGGTWSHTATFQPVDDLDGQTLQASGVSMKANKNDHTIIIMHGQVPLAGAYGQGRVFIGQLGSGTYVQSQTIPFANSGSMRPMSFTNDGSKFIGKSYVGGNTDLVLYAKA